MMKAARKASSKLKGIATGKIPHGKTPKLPITSHIKTKPMNHESRKVCNRLNFFNIAKNRWQFFVPKICYCHSWSSSKLLFSSGTFF